MKTSITILENIIRDYSQPLKNIAEDAYLHKPFPGKWSKKEVIGHLIDSAQNNIRRFIVAQYEESPKIIYAQDRWVIAADYQHYILEELIELWILLNKHLLRILISLPANLENRKIETEQLHTIEWLANDYNKHLLHHLHQILNMKPVDYP